MSLEKLIELLRNKSNITASEFDEFVPIIRKQIVVLRNMAQNMYGQLPSFRLGEMVKLANNPSKETFRIYRISENFEHLYGTTCQYFDYRCKSTIVTDKGKNVKHKEYYFSDRPKSIATVRPI